MPEQAARYEADAWEQKIAEHLQDKSETTLPSIAIDVLNIEIGRISPIDQQRISGVLSHLGWERRRENRRRWWAKLAS